MIRIIEPTLLFDEKKCLANIEFMVNKAKNNNLILRPHFKTHQSREIANYFRDFGINKITVSSVRQAIYFAEDDWEDITVAFPVNILEIDRINYLASAIKLNLLVESYNIVNLLKKKLKFPVEIFIKIDLGYRRTGINPGDTETINSILNEINSSDLLNFAGFLGHAGHSYNAKNVQEIEEIHNTSKSILKELKDKYIPSFPGIIISTGDTPTCCLMNNFENIDEIRPGTFVLFDLFQWGIGVCSLDQVAIAMLCPVVAKHKERREIIVYGGAVHFSKDHSYLASGEKYYGFVVDLLDNEWALPDKSDYLKSISQEHGIVKFNSNRFDKIKEGDTIAILPIHCCLTGNLMKEYRTFDDEIISRL